MTLDDVMGQLEKAGSAQTRKTYGRHGIRSPTFGVSYAVLGKLIKTIKVDQPLAERLWATGNHDARILGTMIADPTTIGRKQLDAWATVADNYVLSDALERRVPGMAAKGRIQVGVVNETIVVRRGKLTPGWTCDSCQWITVSLGRICFLVGCDPEWNNCSSICINLPKDDFPVS